MVLSTRADAVCYASGLTVVWLTGRDTAGGCLTPVSFTDHGRHMVVLAPAADNSGAPRAFYDCLRQSTFLTIVLRTSAALALQTCPGRACCRRRHPPRRLHPHTGRPSPSPTVHAASGQTGSQDTADSRVTKIVTRERERERERRNKQQQQPEPRDRLLRPDGAD